MARRLITREEMRDDDPWLYKRPSTEEELREERIASIAELAEAGHIIDRGFTCDNCGMKAVCSLAFDGYNTNGDCLYDK